MNIFQSEVLKQPDDQIVTSAMALSEKCDATSLDYERDRLRNVLLQGVQSAPSGFVDEAYFAALRSSITSR